MNAPMSFDEALDAAIDAVRAGTPIERVLAAVPEHRGELRALLAPFAAAPAAAPQFDAARMTAGYRRVHGAVLDARDATSRAWWRRPVSFASLSIPAGIVALAAIGAAGAAAGGAAAMTGHNVPAAVEQIVTLGTRGGGDASSHGNHNGHGANPENSGGAGSAASDATAAANGEPPHATGQPVQFTASGAISDAHANVFTLTAADGTAWNVNIDANTQVTGAIEDGASATVTGDATSTTDKNLHADTVDVTAPPAPGPQGVATPTGTASHGSGPEHTPGVPQGTPAAGNGNENANGASATARAGADPDGTGPPGQDSTRTTGIGNGGGTGRKP